jgi:ribulose-phosphate 3-epimerase
MVTIAPSILAADFSDLHGQIALAVRGGADWIHLDVMDGRFVPNITIGPPVVSSIRKATSLPLDTHLMIEDPDRYLEAFRQAGADIITVHVEATKHLHRTVQRVKELGAKAGVSINPATPVSVLTDILADVDLVLIMTVNPGFGGQSFIRHSLTRIRETAEMIRRIKPGVSLEVDGGIDEATAPEVVKAGANVLVAGQFIFGSPDIPGAVRSLRAHADAAQLSRTGSLRAT